MKRFLLLLAVAALFAAACGGTDNEPNPAAFGGGENTEVCETVPASVQGVSVLGHRVKGISNLKVCVSADVAANAVPQLRNQSECGDPCFTIEIANFNVAADEKVAITYNREDESHEIGYDPEPINKGTETGRLCIIGYGTPDPCMERITKPGNVTAAPAKFKVSLSWNAAEDTGGAPLVGYEVWRSLSGEQDTFSLVGTVAELQYVDQGVSRKTSYWYYVVAVDGDGNHGPASAVVQATTR